MDNKKIATIFGGAVFALVVLFYAAPTQANHVTFFNPPSCGISTSSGDIKIGLPQDRLFSTGSGAKDSHGNSLFNPDSSKNVSIPAGKYQVVLQSFDGYSIRASSNQPREYYHVIFKNSGTTVATSGKTADLKDGVNSATWKGTVNSSLTFNKGINNIVVRHSAYLDNSSPNSLVPVCMVLRPIKPPVNGVCNSKYDGEAVSSKPGEDRCTTGAASSVSGAGTETNPWKWSCAGKNGGKSDQCSATQKPICGNGKKEAGEQCDDGNKNNNDGCSAQCKIEKPAINIVKRDATDKDDIQEVKKGGTAVFEIIVTNTGNVDLKNVKVTDPKAPECNKTIGDLKVGESKTYSCTVKNVTKAFTNIAFVVGTSIEDETKVTDDDPSKVDVGKEQPVCGNGVKETGEQCDDGNANNNDSCTNQCMPKAGPSCGNDIVEAGEECDGGSDCTKDCKEEEEDDDECDGSIGNTVWIDTNGNGVEDPGEDGLSGVTVKLIDGNDVEKDNTNSSGRYKHDDLCKGTYTVVVDANDIPEGCYQVSDPDGKIDHSTKVKLGNDDNHTKADFGYRCPVAPATGPGTAAIAIGSALAATLAILYFGLVHPRVRRQDFNESIIG